MKTIRTLAALGLLALAAAAPAAMARQPVTTIEPGWWEMTNTLNLVVSKTEVEYNEWKALLKAMVDPVAAKLDEIMDKAAEAVNAASELPDVRSRNNFQPALLAADEALQSMIDTFPAHAAKLEKERERLNEWFAALARGKKVSRQ